MCLPRPKMWFLEFRLMTPYMFHVVACRYHCGVAAAVVDVTDACSPADPSPVYSHGSSRRQELKRCDNSDTRVRSNVLPGYLAPTARIAAFDTIRRRLLGRHLLHLRGLF